MDKGGIDKKILVMIFYNSRTQPLPVKNHKNNFTILQVN